MSKAEKIIKQLQAKNAYHSCPTCGWHEWSVVDPEKDGYVMTTLTTDPNIMSVPQPHIPTYAIICDSCGYIRFHAISVLMDEDK